MNKIIKELMSFKTAIAIIFITVIGNVFANLALPAYLSNIINIAIPQEDILQMISIGGIMLVFVVVSLLCNLATGFFASRVSMKLGKRLRSQVFQQIQFFSQHEFDLFSTSSLITRTQNDVIQIQNFVNMVLRISLMAPIMCVGGILLAFAKNASLSLILVIAMPIMAFVIIKIAKIAMPLSMKMQQKIDRINLVMRERLTGIRVSLAFGTETFEEDKFKDVNEDFMENAIKMNRVMGSMTPALSLVLYGTMVALLAMGGYQTFTKAAAIPIGDIIAVIQYVMQILMAVMLLAMVFIMYPRAAVSAQRIKEVLDTESIIQEVQEDKESNLQGHVEFKDVSFHFPTSSHNVLNHISFHSKPGETTAIIGSTGSGKSALVNLIPRFYDIQAGQILIDGIDIKDYTLRTLRQKIGYVPQKAFLFKGTIADNIRFGNDEADQKQVEEASQIAQAYAFIEDKEEGFMSAIAQGGTNVSGGQKQRLSIARSIVRKPEIYIFDDSFSALDFKTDAALRAALKKETEHATVILVAQRVSTIMNADRILVLDNGECVGMGKHEELIKTCDVYKEIVNSQMKKGENV